jgi:predicted dehydrogenase
LQREQKVRVGIVGAGFAASSHIDALRRISEVEVAGIAGSRPERGQQAAERLGIDRAFPDWRVMVQDDAIDAVHDCTPNHLHAEINSAALAAGKHVLSEKPLAMDSAQSGRLVEEAVAANVVSGVCFNYRHFPLVRHLREVLAGAEFGPVHLVHGAYLQDWLLLPSDWNWRLEAEKGGASRAMADIGSHWLDLAQHVTGDRVTEVLAELATVHGERMRPVGEVETFARGGGEGRTPVAVQSEDAGSVLLRFATGARGTLTVSQVSAGWKNHLVIEVDAAQAAFVWDQEDPNRLRIGQRNEANRELPRDPGLVSPGAAALTHYPGGHQEGWPDALRNLFGEFYQAVRAHREGREVGPTFASFAEAHGIIRVVEAVVASYRSGQWTKVET